MEDFYRKIRSDIACETVSLCPMPGIYERHPINNCWLYCARILTRLDSLKICLPVLKKFFVPKIDLRLKRDACNAAVCDARPILIYKKQYFHEWMSFFRFSKVWRFRNPTFRQLQFGNCLIKSLLQVSLQRISKLIGDIGNTWTFTHLSVHLRRDWTTPTLKGDLLYQNCFIFFPLLLRGLFFKYLIEDKLILIYLVHNGSRCYQHLLLTWGASTDKKILRQSPVDAD